MESFRAEVLLGRMVRLRNRAENLMHEVLELCCSEWFQNLFDRTATTAKWVTNDIYGEALALFTRFDTKKTDEAAGKFVTYTDAV